MFLRSLCPVVVFLVVQPSFGSVPVVDASTLHGKVVTGYQGWFGAPGDGNTPQVGWFHWSKTSDNIGPGLYNVDMWPDMSGFDEDELYLAPNVQLTDGSPAVLFSSRNPKTVARHFKWMKDAGIDGIFLQRFVNELSSPAHLAHRNAVLENVRAAANTYGRIFAIEYDVSGATESTMASVIAADWQYLVETLDILNDPRYLYHDGKPVVIVWGLGLQGNPGTPEIATQIIDFLKNYGGGQTLIGGVDRGWRTLTLGSKTDPAWASVYHSFDIITPWTVGAYLTTAEINSYRTNLMVPDMNECNSLGIGYLPVVWPGFCWDNMKGLAPDESSNILRRNGSHLWDQVYSTKLAGANMLFVAMFDEVDESTAIFKVSEVHPVTDHWVTYEGLPGDWYMRLAGAAQRMLNGAIPLVSAIPISPACGGEEVSFNLGEDEADRMAHIQVGDGNTQVATAGGKSCRRNVSMFSDLYFYFGVDDDFAYQGSQPTLCVTIDYYDTGLGSLSLQYDSNTGDTVAAKYKNGGSVSLTNSQQWRRAIFTVQDAYFGNRQNNGADFRIAKSSIGYFYLDRVLVGSPLPPGPVIQLDVTALEHAIEAGESLPDEVFTITNVGGSDLHYQISTTAGWLSTSVQEGLSTGETDQITISYAVSELAGGNYSGSIVVNDLGGSGATASIQVNLQVIQPPVASDFDEDGDVDLEDFGFLQRCYSALPVSGECVKADLNNDGFVNQEDFVKFSLCFRGEGIPSDPSCQE